MTWRLVLTLGVLTLGVCVLASRWLLKRRWQREDETWAPTGVRQVYAGHDESRGSAAYRRSRTRTPSGREYKRVQSERSKVLPLRQRGN